MSKSLNRFLALGLLVLTGCGGPPSLSGLVTMDGQPLAKATVVLTPLESGAEMVVGTTGTDGRFVITPAAGSSISLGTYKVTISKREELTQAQMEAYTPAKELVPDKYSDLRKTALTITVPTEGEIEFPLTK